MKLASFMTVYKVKKTEEDKVKEVKKHIKNEYIPYEQKADMAKAIVYSSCYKKDNNGRDYLCIDSVSKHMLTCLTIIDLFTDIERSKQEGKALNDFNTLNSAGLFDIIISLIDQRELKEFNMLIKMTFDDLVANEYEPHAFIRNQVDRFGLLISSIMGPMINELDPEKMKEIVLSLNGIKESLLEQ